MPSDALEAAEAALGQSFPASYREFLHHHGVGHYRDYALLGSGRLEIDGVSEYEELYDVMAQGRDIASRLVVLDAAEGDEIYWLALNERDEQNECPVYCDNAFGQTDEPFAPTYADFLWRLHCQGQSGNSPTGC